MLPQLAGLIALAAAAQQMKHEANKLDPDKKKKKKRSPASEKRKQAIKDYLQKSKEKERKVYKGKKSGNDDSKN